MALKADTPIKQLDAVLSYLYDENRTVGKEPMNFALFPRFYDELIEGFENRGTNEIDNEDLILAKFEFMEQILNHLVNDGYAQPYNRLHFSSETFLNKSKRNDENWRITVKGAIFWEVTKGYMGQELKEQLDRKRIETLQLNQLDSIKWANQLTFWIATGTVMTAIYYLVELLKYFGILPQQWK